MTEKQYYYHSIQRFFLTYFFSLLVASLIYTGYLELVEAQTLIKHKEILNALAKSIEIYKVPPNDIDALNALENPKEENGRQLKDIIKTERKKHNLQYYSDAWQKPGEVLLESSLLLSDIITFGDGSQAIVSGWYPKDSDNGRRIGPSLKQIVLPGVFLLVLPAITFWAIAALIQLFTRSRLTDKARVGTDSEKE
jgi:hypothetical protein